MGSDGGSDNDDDGDVMMEFVAIIGGYLNTLYLLFLKHITHICSLFM